ncbi:MAG: ABC-type dipeptide/oligopeptide/nickel transport system ATPase subunit [Planctomycetota bacterium]
MTILKITDLSVRLGNKQILDGVSCELEAGRCLSVVGESGSGKSTLLKAICGLISFQSGNIKMIDKVIRPQSRRRPGDDAKTLQMVFQDPTASLDPRWPAWRIVTECLPNTSAATLKQAASQLLDDVGLDQACADRFPHELSGGQKQRLGIARAIAPRPKILLLDEPVSALDTSVQAGILDLFARLQAERELTYLFVSHDLAVVRFLADEILVLKDGRVVEKSTTESLLSTPSHPYTQSLIRAAQELD